MRKISSVLLCAGLFCGVVADSGEAYGKRHYSTSVQQQTTYQVTKSDVRALIGKLLNGQRSWFNVSRGVKRESDNTLGKHLVNHHESKSATEPTILWDDQEGYIVATQFLKGQAIAGMGAALKSIYQFWDERNVRIKPRGNNTFEVSIRLSTPIEGYQVWNSPSWKPRNRTLKKVSLSKEDWKDGPLNHIGVYISFRNGAWQADSIFPMWSF